MANNTTKQHDTIALAPMSAKQIKDKYSDLVAQYPVNQAGKVQYRTLSNECLFASAKAIGLAGLLAYWSAYDLVNESYTVPRITPLWIAKRLGYVKSQASRHVDKIQELLDELAEWDQIEIDKDKQTDTQTITIAKDHDRLNSFAKIYAPTISTILAQSKGMTTLYRVAIYVAIRSITYEVGPLNTPVYAYPPSYLAEQLGMATSTVQKHLAWLRDHGALCYYQCVMANMYHTVKYIYSDPVNVGALVPYIIDHIDTEHNSKPTRRTRYISKVVA
ncbi:hypothetical protein PO185_05820 [Limosilactobacillus mucosae]|uniref:hypothetical protein n=1 Tax=Limosilactobacillus mucosae TaxID=97478 RepID=UPI00233EEC8F|nr:hypothetical protein [Limosilactobacillus mucosae]MDC2845181.1 hypothetical protein [Limosilactobacillus mucosae]